jgi:hypothetical protein
VLQTSQRENALPVAEKMVLAAYEFADNPPTTRELVLGEMRPGD